MESNQAFISSNASPQNTIDTKYSGNMQSMPWYKNKLHKALRWKNINIR